MKRDQFWILDGHGLIYRAIFGPGAPLTAPGSGEPTRGTYSFTRTLISLVRDYSPAYLAIAMDAPRGTTFRRKLFPGYKANRDESEIPEEVPIQLRRIRQLVEALGIPAIEVPTFEADDVIATLADLCASEEVEVVVASADKDLNQLVGPDVRQYDPAKGTWLNEPRVEEKWGVSVDRLVDVMTLAGDSGDAVPGVPGIGLATAVKLVNEYGSVEEIVRRAEELTPAKRKAILGADLRLCRQLVELRRDVPLEGWTTRDLEFDGLDTKAAMPLFRKLGFQSLL